jgi:hypothetical protein
MAKNDAKKSRLVRTQFFRRLAAWSCLCGLPLGLGTAALGEQGTVSVELNKLEAQGGQCNAYFVVTNKSDTTYKELKLDLVLFRPDGVIGRRFAVDMAPLKPQKRAVKLFEIADMRCDEVANILVNDAVECKAESGPIVDCLKDIALTSLTKVQLSK